MVFVLRCTLVVVCCVSCFPVVLKRCVSFAVVIEGGVVHVVVACCFVCCALLFAEMVCWRLFAECCLCVAWCLVCVVFLRVVCCLPCVVCCAVIAVCSLLCVLRVVCLLRWCELFSVVLFGVW